MKYFLSLSLILFVFLQNQAMTKVDHYLEPLKRFLTVDDIQKSEIEEAFNNTFNRICEIAIENPDNCLRMLAPKRIKKTLDKYAEQLTEKINQHYSAFQKHYLLEKSFYPFESKTQSFTNPNESLYFSLLWQAVDQSKKRLFDKISTLIDLLQDASQERPYMHDSCSLCKKVEQKLFWRNLMVCTIL